MLFVKCDVIIIIIADDGSEGGSGSELIGNRSVTMNLY